MKVRIRRPDDMHRHLRQGPMLGTTLKYLGPFARALCMPNLTPPIANRTDVERYSGEISQSLPSNTSFTPLIAIKLLDSTTPAIIEEAYNAGAAAVKVYFRGTTTNSEDGVLIQELEQSYPVFEKMQYINRLNKRKILLLWHGENPLSDYCLDQEEGFLNYLVEAHRNFPGLKMVMEHITTQAAVNVVKGLGDNVAATITPHHLRLTTDSIIRGKLRPHNFCMPVAKRPQDRNALIEAAISGNPKFFLGTDDAPHARNKKECAEGCAGVWTGPYGLNHYAEVFEQAEALDKLEGFASVFGARFYELPLNEDCVDLVREPLLVEPELDGLVPFMAGQTLNWQAV
ncbi:MAG: dihydroorotase [Nitrospiraceae bacterium]|nr:dihydroorotase [Nitrospiraceae bacterium]